MYRIPKSDFFFPSFYEASRGVSVQIILSHVSTLVSHQLTNSATNLDEMRKIV